MQKMAWKAPEKTTRLRDDGYGNENENENVT